MNKYIDLLLRAGQSNTDMVKSFKTTPLVWTLEINMGWHLFMQISLAMWNVTLMSKTFPSSAKLLALESNFTSYFQQTVTYPMFPPYLIIFYQQTFVWLVLKHIINSMIVHVSWMVRKMWCISSNSLICLLGITSNSPLIIVSPICLSLATLYTQRKSGIWLSLTLILLWFHSIIIWSSLITEMLRLMNSNMSLIFTSRCNALVLELKKM